MPLSEFLLRTTKSKPGTAQSKMLNSSSDPFSMSDHEFAELLWENGQIILHGHSNRSNKKGLLAATASDHQEKAQEKDGGGSVDPKSAQPNPNPIPIDQLGAADLSAHQEDDMAPWINFRIDESLGADPGHNDFYPEFLEEIGVLGQEAKGSQTAAQQELPLKAVPAASEPGRSCKPNQLLQFSQHCQSSAANDNSRVLELANNGCGSGGGGGKTQMGSCMEVAKSTRLENRNAGTSAVPRSNTGVNFVNFPLFSRPNTFRINDRVRCEEKASAAPMSCNLVESTLVKSGGGNKGAAGIRAQPARLESEKPDDAPRRVKFPTEQIEANHDGDETEKDYKNAAAAAAAAKDCGLTASMALMKPETEKGPEAVVASSSVCSVNSAGIESYEPKNNREKRKVREGDESSGEQSEDLEDESVGTKKPANARGPGAKRSRAAEVHNLSERRRRDRINEKMRALQELIPNCNKTDKASMLEEAIEYLKALQLQLQMMSMRSGMYMPTPMMLPPGMQHINGPPMAHFSPMGVGMGMGMGMGYGMHMNGSPGCSLLPVQPIHGQQFPFPPIAGQAALHRMMLGPANPSVFGAIVPHPLSSPPGPAVKGNVAPEVTVPAAAPAPPTSEPAAAPVSKDREQEGKKL